MALSGRRACCLVHFYRGDSPPSIADMTTTEHRGACASPSARAEGDIGVRAVNFGKQAED